jgi:guanine deaminase
MTEQNPDYRQGQQHRSFMDHAVRLARDGMLRGDGGPFGAVVVENGVVVGEGWNRVVSGNDPTAHGEIMAIRDAGARLGRFDLSGCVLYTTGQPCPMCLAAIYWAHIDCVFYGFGVEEAARLGFDDVRLFDELKLEPTQRSIPCVKVGSGAIPGLILDYENLPGRIRY